MRQKFIKAVGQLQELFQELYDQGKIDPDQAERYNQAQKEIVNYDSWIQNQQQIKLKVDLPWNDKVFIEAWKLWKDYKKQQFRFTYKEIGEQAALKDLADLSKGDMNTAIQIIHQSIKKSWKGFFALKQNNKEVEESNLNSHKSNLLTRLMND
jgi:hypothetical protein